MKKLVLLSALCIALALSSCGKEETQQPSASRSDTVTGAVETTAAAQTEASSLTASELLDTLLEAAQPKEAMTKLLPGDEDYEDSFDYLFDLDVSVTSDSAVSYCTSGKLADEIDVFVLKDEGDVTMLTSALKKRASSRASTYRGYYDAESDKAKDALIISNGKYVIFAISDNNSAVKKAFGGLF